MIFFCNVSFEPTMEGQRIILFISSIEVLCFLLSLSTIDKSYRELVEI